MKVLNGSPQSAWGDFVDVMTNVLITVKIQMGLFFPPSLWKNSHCWLKWKKKKSTLMFFSLKVISQIKDKAKWTHDQ